MRQAPGGPPAVLPPGAVAPQPSQQPPGAQPTPPGAGQPQAAPQTPPQPVRSRPSKPADPAELRVPLDKEGKLTFNLNNQPWDLALEWLADLGGRTLVVGALPPVDDTLTFRTRERYTIGKAIDVINGVLLAKGFTLLHDGEVLYVTKLEGLDPALIPSVAPSDLGERGRNEIVKTIFPLQSLSADLIKPGVEAVKSKYGRVTALTATNRIEVMDTAGSLRRIWQLLQDEQAEQQLVEEFKLVHVRAEDAATTLRTLLGIKEEAPLSQQERQMQMQMQMQMAQQQQGKPPTGDNKPKVQIAVNARKNSILVTGAPDQIAIVREAIKHIDVLQEKDEQTQRSPFELPFLKIYHLAAISPDTVAKFLQETGELAPSTQLQVETKSKSILAWGTAKDQAFISRYVQELDGNGRRFEVIQLTVLDAEAASGSIDFLMNGKKKDDESNRRRNYFFYDPFRNNQQEEEKSDFRVDADVDRNRLLMYATDYELAQVRDLLTKMGEPDALAAAQAATLRVVPVGPGDAERLLKAIEREWMRFSPDNPLNTVPPRSVPQTDESSKVPESQSQEGPKDTRIEQAPKTKPSSDAAEPVTLTSPVISLAAIARAQEADEADAEAQTPSEAAEVPEQPESQPAQPAQTEQGTDAARQRPDLEALRSFMKRRAQPAPVSVIAGPNGLTVYSADPAVAERMVQLIERLAPPQAEYTVFYLKKAYAEDVADILEDMFKEKDGDDEDSYRPYWYWNDFGSDNKDPARRLSNRKPLKIVADKDTNAVFVRASPGQLAQIKQMIEKLDQPPPQDTEAVRTPHLVRLTHTQAKEVANIITSVYRDFLSSGDPARGQGGGQQQVQSRYVFTYNYGKNSGSGARKTEGSLSVGVDERANTLVISAPQDLFAEIKSEVIDPLENASRKPRSAFRVVGLKMATPPKSVQEALSKVLGREPKPEKPGEQPDAKKDQGQPKEREIGNGPVILE